MDKETIKDIAIIKSKQEQFEDRLEKVEKEHVEWQKFCVRLVIKTGLTLLGILTLGTFWGYLSPAAKDIVKGLIK